MEFRSRLGPNNAFSNTTCYYCGEQGHIAQACTLRSNERQRNYTSQNRGYRIERYQQARGQRPRLILPNPHNRVTHNVQQNSASYTPTFRSYWGEPSSDTYYSDSDEHSDDDENEQDDGEDFRSDYLNLRNFLLSLDAQTIFHMSRFASVSRGTSASLIANLPEFTFTKTNPEGSKEREMCVVCQMDYEENDLCVTLPCVHNYHKPCISEWLKQNTKCPLCKDDLQTWSH